MYSHLPDDIIKPQIVLRGTQMEELLREIVGKLGKLDTIENEIKELKKEQRKISNNVSNIETLLVKGAFEDIKRLEKRIDVLEKNAV